MSRGKLTNEEKEEGQTALHDISYMRTGPHMSLPVHEANEFQRP